MPVGTTPNQMEKTMEPLYTEHQVGQEIIIERRGSSNTFYILGYKITKVTKSHVTVERGEGADRSTSTFHNHKSGKEVGCSNAFSPSLLSDLTPELYWQLQEKGQRAALSMQFSNPAPPPPQTKWRRP